LLLILHQITNPLTQFTEMEVNTRCGMEVVCFTLAQNVQKNQERQSPSLSRDLIPHSFKLQFFKYSYLVNPVVRIYTQFVIPTHVI
jgi:hypothetical protein